MIKQIINYFFAWVRGDDAQLDVEFRVVITWLDLAVTIALIALLVYLWR